MRVPIRLRQLVGCIALSAYTVACTTWQTQEVSPEELMQNGEPERVRVTLADGSTREYVKPWVEADSVYGHGSPSAPSADPTSVEDIRSIEVHKVDGVGTAVFVTLVVLSVAAVAAAIAAASFDCCFGN